MANRLTDATSPYLQQHADNPVDWWPWCTEAFEEARRRDVPVLLSIGYAACHWCHVMAHESFEDEAVAAVVNELTVPVKVDREERPDVDAVYMTATQVMTGQGGWPMTVFTTPDGEPFFCGTYFPRDGFLRLVNAVAQTWRERRESLLQQGAAVVEAITRATGRAPTGPMTAEVLDAAAQSLARGYDREHAGFGGAPKFPPHMNLLFLLRHHERTGDPRSLAIASATCRAMARGGMYDQLAGGFARYSVDRTWTVPHFEKMLYDNALLLRVYTEVWRQTGDPFAGRIAAETVDFLLDDLDTPAGGFASSLDADTDGVEGATYAWTPAQLRDELGDDDAAWAGRLLQVTPAGTFEHGTSVLQMRGDPDDPARWRSVRDRLLAARRRRPQPGRDDKVVAAWNGLAVTALVEYARVASAIRPTGAVDRGGEPAGPAAAAHRGAEAVEAAGRAALALAERHLVAGRLRRVSRDGVVGEPAGVLDDYGCVAEAFCAMHQLTADGRWLTLAGQLLDSALQRFADGRGAFFDTADDAERLVTRPADPTDNATPSGLSAVAAALVAYSALTGEVRYREAAHSALATVAAIAAQHARFTGYACAGGEALLAGPLEIAVAISGEPAGAAEAAATAATAEPAGGAEPAGTAARAEPPALAGTAADPLLREVYRRAPGGSVIVVGPPDAPGVPLLAHRPLRGGVSTAYVCRGFVCDAPVTDPGQLAGRLRG